MCRPQNATAQIVGSSQIRTGFRQSTQFGVSGSNRQAQGRFHFRLPGNLRVLVQSPCGDLQDFLHRDFLLP